MFVDLLFAAWLLHACCLQQPACHGMSWDGAHMGVNKMVFSGGECPIDEGGTRVGVDRQVLKGYMCCLAFNFTFCFNQKQPQLTSRTFP